MAMSYEVKITRPPELQDGVKKTKSAHDAMARAFPLGVHNLSFLPAGGPQRPVPAADVAVGVDGRQLVACVHMVDVDFLATPTHVIDLEGAAGAIPFLIRDKSEGGAGAKSEDKKNDEAYETHQGSGQLTGTGDNVDKKQRESDRKPDGVK
ncbi:MAG: hypothetical protein Q9173_000355 [Seirophora scorigena]